MGVREIDRSLEQWQMGVKDWRRRMILAPTVPRQAFLPVPVASLRNVTETLALGVRPNQR